MKLTKDVDLSLDNFEKGKDFTVNYSGELFKNGSNDVYLSFGYGDNWDNKEEIKMVKSQTGYQANVNPKNYGAFNFCFRDSNNVWDNNSYKNYSINIENQSEINLGNGGELLGNVQGFGGTNLGGVNEAGGIGGVDEAGGIGDITEAGSVGGIGGVAEAGEIGGVLPDAEITANPGLEETERKTFNIDAIIEEILNTEIAPAPVQQVVPEEPKIEKIVAKENPSHINKTSLLVEDVLVPFYANESSQGNNGQFLPVDPKTYSKFFTITRKIKLAIYKIINAIPKLVTGNYTKKKNVQN